MKHLSAYHYRPKWYDAIITLILGVFALVMPDFWLRDVIVAILTFQAASLVSLRYWEQHLARMNETENVHTRALEAEKEYLRWSVRLLSSKNESNPDVQDRNGVEL